AEPDLGIVVRKKRDRRIDAVPPEFVVVAEQAALFVHDVQAYGDVIIDSLARIQGEAPIAERAGLERRIVDPGAVRFLERSVEKAAADPAAEGQGTRASQDFDALGVVEIPEILNVIAKSVDEEIRARVHTANDELVAVAFALM